ncbi:MAG: cupin domain-containing protein [Candidatus Levybacteria bacterium CG10_big_fil_rev_8_21_14_0_10_36_7]|nr:MAG: cupin domain-containing protein [Candidatus Levybacteria bacterium CG10_big_fil_rev_8_21_14_0_10_36_7]
MQGVVKNIIQKAKENTFFRQVLETGDKTQIVIMSIPKGGEIGEEVHPDNDQVLFLAEGQGETILNEQKTAFEQGDIVLVRAGIKHNFVNTGEKDLKIITTYSPSHHPAGTVHKTKEEADKAEY